MGIAAGQDMGVAARRGTGLAPGDGDAASAHGGFLTRLYGRWLPWPVGRKVALFAAGGVGSLGFESLIAHFAGNPSVRPIQFVPPLFSLLCAATLVGSLFALRAPALARTLRTIGAASMLVGAIGTGFHAWSLLDTLGADPLTWKNIETALSLSPPIFAPGGFLAVGLLLFVLPKILPEAPPA